MTEHESFEVVCPSQLTGMVRPLLVGDVSAMSARSSRKNNDPLGQMFRSVWQKTISPGIYSDGIQSNGSIDNWGDILLGDRSFLVYEIRRLTYGDDFYFNLPCRSCKSKISWQIDLNDLEIHGLSDEAKNAVDANGLDAVLYRTLPKSGKKVGIRLLTGRDQKLVEKAQREGDGAVAEAALLARLSFMEDANSPGERRKFVKNLHLVDLEYLREEWEEADIYVQDSVEIECQSCGMIQEVFIPTDERFFSVRSARPDNKKRGKRSRS